MLQLNELTKLKKNKKRVGRGGERGGTSGRGHKGQGSRSGVSGELKAFFEGGQMPLSRRLPARGFNNRFKKNFKIVNLKDLESHFSANDVVNKESLFKTGLIKGKKKCYIKVLGNGELTKSLDVQVDAISKSAAMSIEKSGGKLKLTNEENSSGINT